MSEGERKALDFTELEDFKPREKKRTRRTAKTKKAVDKVSDFPSRDVSDDGQINIKGPTAILERFREMAKAERYRHAEFLEILMNAYEGK